MNRDTLTYSALSKFRNCRKAYDYRYNQSLVSLESDPNLSFGSVIHSALELWHRYCDLPAVLDSIDAAYADREQNDSQKENWHKATAIMKAYAARYPEEDFKVVALEKNFSRRIVNPKTGGISRSFVLRGKADGIIERDGRLLLLEHKTAGVIDAGYLERLWNDLQIILYCYALEASMNIRFDGVLYNVIAKTRIAQSKGETQAEFEQRHAELAAKNKSGKSNAQRKMPETDEQFQARLAEWYSQPEAFIRQELILSRDKLRELEFELWELTQAILRSRREGIWYRNTSQCFVYNRPCAYLPLCSAGDNAASLIENLYRIEPPHRELTDDKSDNQ